MAGTQAGECGDRPAGTVVAFGDLVEPNGRTRRQNNLSIQHKIPIDTLVEVKYDEWFGDGSCRVVHARLWVVEHTRDCDGTPLYKLANKRNAEIDRLRTEYNEILAEKIFSKVASGFAEESLIIVPVTPELCRGEGALTSENS